MKEKKDKKLMDEYKVFGEKILGYSPKQALSAYFIKKGRKYDFEKYLPDIDKYVKLIKEGVKEKSTKINRLEKELAEDWNVSRETKEYFVALELAQSFYKNHPEKATNHSTFLPRYEERVKNMKNNQLDALYAKLCLKLTAKQ